MKVISRATLLAALLTLVAALACNPTGGVPVDVTIVFERVSSPVFTTASGWEVELAEARALVGPIYAYAPPGDLARRLLGPTAAFAHGGHDPTGGRVVRAELLEQHVIDALAPDPREIARVRGLAGAADELTIVLDAPIADHAAADGPTRGHHVWVAGTARRDGVEVVFEGGLDLDEPHREVIGVDIRGDDLDEGSAIAIGADARAWLAEADFAQGGVSEGSQPHRALRLGVRSAASWTARTEHREGGRR